MFPGVLVVQLQVLFLQPLDPPVCMEVSLNMNSSYQLPQTVVECLGNNSRHDEFQVPIVRHVVSVVQGDTILHLSSFQQVSLVDSLEIHTLRPGLDLLHQVDVDVSIFQVLAYLDSSYIFGG